MRLLASETRRGGARPHVRAHHGLPTRLLLLIAAALATLVLATSVRALDVTLQVNAAPPALPVYDQPPIPGPGYLWTPGYWAYGPEGWFWVPGTWVEPPAPALVWTPGYWGWQDGMYVWNAGYWGPQVGFYGGIDYGFGYSGRGYDGGYWQGNQFYYNRAVTNITNVNITNVYTKSVSNTTTVNTVSYNGGNGGVTTRPTPQEEAMAHQPHEGPTSMQAQQVTAAASNHEQLASVNHGRPPVTATAKPGAFSAQRNATAPADHAPLHLSEADRSQAQPQQRPESPQQRPLSQPEKPAPQEHARPAPPAPEAREGRSPPPAPPQDARPGRPAPESHAPSAPQAGHGNARPEQHSQERPQHESEKRPEPQRKPDEGKQ